MGTWLTIGLYGIAAAVCLWMLVTLIKSKRPVRGLLGSALQGACALAAVNVTGMFTGVSLGINVFTGAVSAVLGVPGVITLLLLKVIFSL